MKDLKTPPNSRSETDSEIQSGLTDFGFQTVSPEQKTSRVKAVFDSVAPKYNLMNDLMSLGLHRLWKRLVVTKMSLLPHHTLLDLASGTGDLVQLYLAEFKNPHKIVVSDINLSMLKLARDRLLNAGHVSALNYLTLNAECIPFSNNSFDRISMSFGLRNVTNKPLALKEIYRVLKPGGRFVVLEFSHVKPGLFSKFYEYYSFNVIPWLGERICQDKESYQYLVESIRMHPDQETLKNMMETAGFEKVEYQNIQGGIVAIHMGFKF